MGDFCNLLLDKIREEIKIKISLLEMLSTIEHIQLSLKSLKKISQSSLIAKGMCVGFIEKIIVQFPCVWEYEEMIRGWEKSFNITLSEKEGVKNGGITSGDRDSKSDEPR